MSSLRRSRRAAPAATEYVARCNVTNVTSAHIRTLIYDRGRAFDRSASSVVYVQGARGCEKRREGCDAEQASGQAGRATSAPTSKRGVRPEWRRERVIATTWRMTSWLVGLLIVVSLATFGCDD